MNEDCYGIIEAALNGIKPYFVAGALRWADKHRPELTKKEKLLQDTINRLCVNDAPTATILAVVRQWENTILEIFAECNRFIENGFR